MTQLLNLNQKLFVLIYSSPHSNLLDVNVHDCGSPYEIVRERQHSLTLTEHEKGGGDQDWIYNDSNKALEAFILVFYPLPYAIEGRFVSRCCVGSAVRVVNLRRDEDEMPPLVLTPTGCGG